MLTSGLFWYSQQPLPTKGRLHAERMGTWTGRDHSHLLDMPILMAELCRFCDPKLSSTDGPDDTAMEDVEEEGLVDDGMDDAEANLPDGLPANPSHETGATSGTSSSILSGAEEVPHTVRTRAMARVSRAEDLEPDVSPAKKAKKQPVRRAAAKKSKARPRRKAQLRPRRSSPAGGQAKRAKTRHRQKQALGGTLLRTWVTFARFFLASPIDGDWLDLLSPRPTDYAQAWHHARRACPAG